LLIVFHAKVFARKNFSVKLLIELKWVDFATEKHGKTRKNSFRAVFFRGIIN